MDATDRAELIKVELEVDAEYQKNGLLVLPFAEAVLNLLVAAELRTMGLVANSTFLGEYTAGLDSQLFALMHAMRWLREGCSRVEEPVPFASIVQVKNGAELLSLGLQYDRFATAFPYWHRRVVALKLEGTHIRVAHQLDADPEYEAYNRLIAQAGGSTAPGETPLAVMREVSLYSRQVAGRVYLPLTSPAYRIARDYLAPIITESFSLPADWKFGRYTLDEFRRTAIALRGVALGWTLAFLHSGLVQRPTGIGSSVMVVQRTELIEAVTRLSEVAPEQVQAIIEDLTFGERGIRAPDPALQPLVRANSTQMILAPQLLLGTSAERNLTALLNMIPAERQIYSNLVQLKEESLRRRMIERIREQSTLTAHWGAVPSRPDLPDVDLVLVDDQARSALVLEIKWFIDPAEVREMLARGEEIAKGIAQLKRLASARDMERSLLEPLGVDANCRVGYAVASANWIGQGYLQDVSVPVIQADHLLRRLAGSTALSEVLDWLSTRAYLPQQGRDFLVRPVASQVGRFSLDWYGIQPLVTTID